VKSNASYERSRLRAQTWWSTARSRCAASTQRAHEAHEGDGYGDGYRYPHAEGGHAGGVSYLPKELEGRRYYEPKDVGFEARIKARLTKLRGEPTDEVSGGRGRDATSSAGSPRSVGTSAVRALR